ncbi:hypothetical protein [Halobellus captivus]|uniref:hypothetical protein n=1 Tax=Halobellus captivus TaxID=2592614 RepID=UPI0011A62696|nr:hypothetical protein [Halobellus captivus]
MHRRTYLAGAVTAIAATAGCSSLSGSSDEPGNGGGDGASTEESVSLHRDDPDASGAQTLRVPVSEAIAGQTLGAVSATYPRDRFVVDSASHDAITVGVDRTGDGSLDEEFGSDAISGANNNEYSFTVSMDTEYELRQGDVVALEYPAVRNPDESDEYEVTVGLNDQQEATTSVVIE